MSKRKADSKYERTRTENGDTACRVKITLNDGSANVLFGDDETASSEDEEVEMTVAPDGGWGWVIVFASFMVHVLTDGVVYGFGVIIEEFEHNEQFEGISTAQLGFLGGLLPSVIFLSGPLSSALCNIYGCRIVTIGGAIFSAVAFGLSIFVKNFAVFYLTIGVLTGIGFGMVYLPAIVMVGYYFEKRRSFATGIAVCGSGIGMIVMSKVMHGLLKIFDWQNTFLILTGLILNCVLCGAVMRPLKPVKVKKSKSVSSSEEDLAPPVINGLYHPIGSIEETNIENEEEDKHFPAAGDVKNVRHSSETNVAALGDQPRVRKTSESGRSPPIEAHSHHRSYRRHIHHTESTAHSHRMEQGTALAASHMLMLSHRDLFYPGSLQHIPLYRSNPAVYNASMRALSVREMTRPDGSIQEEVQATLWQQIKASFSVMFDFSLLKDLPFLLFAISNLLTSFGFNAPFLFQISLAVHMGHPKDEAPNLNVVIGAANTVGRILFGFLADHPKVNRLMLYNSCLTICGIFVAITPVINAMWWFYICSAGFGLFIGAYVSLTAVIVVDLLGIESLNNAFGILLVFQGSSTLVGPLILGIIKETFNGYEGAYAGSGAMISISGLILFALPAVHKWANGNGDADEKEYSEAWGKKRDLFDTDVEGEDEAEKLTRRLSSRISN